MRIQIITERELKDEDFWPWVHVVVGEVNKMRRMDGLMPSLKVRDFTQLLKGGEVSFEDNLGYTKARTTYRIVKEG